MAASSADNRMVQELPVSFLCVSRKLQERPYEPLHPADISQAVVQQMSLRPAPYVAQDTLFEFYSIIQGHCNVPTLQVGTIDLLSASPTSAGVPAPGCGANALASTGAILGPCPSSSGTGTTPLLGGEGGVNAVGGTDAAESYRLAQIRQNERHVNSKGARICSYFNTREGCRRGPNCPFIHISGTVM